MRVTVAQLRRIQLVSNHRSLDYGIGHRTQLAVPAAGVASNQPERHIHVHLQALGNDSLCLFDNNSRVERTLELDREVAVLLYGSFLEDPNRGSISKRSGQIHLRRSDLAYGCIEDIHRPNYVTP